MEPLTIAVNCIMILALGRAVVTDLRSRRISNKLTYPVMAIGLLVNTALSGTSGLSTSVFGWMAGIGLLLIPFAIGAMGAGDVKLLAAIGALKGPHFVLLALVYGAIAGGLVAIYYLVRERRVQSTFRYLAYGWVGALKGSGPRAGAIPYAPAIAIGAIVALLPFAPLSFSL